MLYMLLVNQSCVTFVTQWTIAHQAPLPMGFSRQEYWSGLPLPSPGDLPNTGIEPWSSALQAVSFIVGRFFTYWVYYIQNNISVSVTSNNKPSFLAPRSVCLGAVFSAGHTGTQDDFLVDVRTGKVQDSSPSHVNSLLGHDLSQSLN